MAPWIKNIQQWRNTIKITISKFKNKDARDIFEFVSQKVFSFIKNLNGENESALSRYMETAMFVIPTPQILQKIIIGLEDLYTTDITGLDIQRDLYEYIW